MGLEPSERPYWVGFNIVQGIGPAKIQALLQTFGTLSNAWHAPATQLRQVGLGQRALDNLLTTRQHINLDTIMARLEREQIRVLTLKDEEYPRNLREIYYAPPVIYVQGTLTPADEWAIAIVGTRRATPYGKEVARRLASDLACNGITVVSGLAMGIDAAAHRAALEADGRTIAVLGSGLDQIYPPQHRRMAESIRANGALISEYPLGTRPEARNFPPRNRIISGLSLGTVVVEAGERSGALITAEYAAEQGREVFAVPGRIFNRSSAGCHRLIQQGAKLVTDVADILEELNLEMVTEHAEAQANLPVSATEAQILTLFSSGDPIHVDELGRLSGLPIQEVTGTLAMMELKGLVRHIGGMHYIRIREQGTTYQTE